MGRIGQNLTILDRFILKWIKLDKTGQLDFVRRIVVDKMWDTLVKGYRAQGNYDALENLLFEGMEDGNLAFTMRGGVMHLMDLLITDYFEEQNAPEKAISLVERYPSSASSRDFGADSFRDERAQLVISHLISHGDISRGLELADKLLLCAFDRGEFLEGISREKTRAKEWEAAEQIADAIPDAIYLGNVYPRKPLPEESRSYNRDWAYYILAKEKAPHCDKDEVQRVLSKISDTDFKKAAISKLTKEDVI